MTDKRRFLPLPELTYLQECFDIKDGELYWRYRPRRHFSSNASFASFNACNSGKKAGVVIRLHSDRLKTDSIFDKVSINNVVYTLERVKHKLLTGEDPTNNGAECCLNNLATMTKLRHHTLEYLKECFKYTKSTDTLIWRERPRKHFGSEVLFKRLNSKYANKRIEAKNGTVSLDKKRYNFDFLKAILAADKTRNLT